jgi:sporulation and spore germination protein
MIQRNLILGVIAMIAIAAGIAIYGWRVRADVVRNTTTLSSGAPIAPPGSGPTEQVTLYIAYDDPGVLKAQSFRIPLPSGRQQRADELLRNVVSIYAGKVSPHPLGPGSEIRGVYLVEPDLAVIDLNGAFAAGHHSGILAEDLMIASLVKTLSTNIPGITRIKILVEGKARETLAGHADLTAFYDVAAVNQMAAQLEAGQ